MLDIIEIYELKNKLYHLASDIDDNLFLKYFESKNLEKYLDVLDAVVYSTVKPISSDISKLSLDEIYNKCKVIIDQATMLSQYQYSKEDSLKLAILYFLDILPIQLGQSDIEKYIQQLEQLISNNTNLPKNEQYLNEELRLQFLALCQSSSELYVKYEDKIQEHLNIAKNMINLRLEINELIKG